MNKIMSSNLPSELPKHRIEFTGNSAPKKRRKPPPKWIVGWFGGLLLFVAGATLGGLAAMPLFRTLTTGDMDSFSGALAALLAGFLSLVVSAVAGGGVGLVVWGILRARAHKLEGLD